MEKRLKENIQKYLRSVIVQEIDALEYSNPTVYLKQSDRVKYLTEFECYVDAVIKENAELRFKLSKNSSKTLNLESDMNILQGEFNEIRSRYMALLNKN